MMPRPKNLAGLMKVVDPDSFIHGEYVEEDVSVLIESDYAHIRIIDHEILWSIYEYAYSNHDEINGLALSDLKISGDAALSITQRRDNLRERYADISVAVDTINANRNLFQDSNSRMLLSYKIKEALKLPETNRLDTYLLLYKNWYRELIEPRRRLMHVYAYLEEFFGMCELDYVETNTSAAETLSKVKYNAEVMCKANGETSALYEAIVKNYQSIYDVFSN